MTKNELLSFAEAKIKVLKKAEGFTHQSEVVKLHQAVGRVTATPILSTMNIPSFDNSAMDGYAVRFNDLKISDRLPVGETSLAGSTKTLNWPAKSCLRIMTGAQIPNDADAVVMQEDVQIIDGQVLFPALSSIKSGQNIRRIGENVKCGQTIFEAGERLTIPKLSTLASLGLSEVNVYQPLKVAIFSTGDELTPIGEKLPASNHIYDSNRFTIHLMLKSLGCEVIDLGIIHDDVIAIQQALEKASTQADLIITSGGVSVGDADYTKKALENIGQINFWKIAMKPGKPFAFGQINQSYFCGLPGNPVSTLVTFYQLVKPFILSLTGLKKSTVNQTLVAKSQDKLKKKPGRLDFQRGYFYCENGEIFVRSTGQQDSHLTTSFHEANCFIILDKESGNIDIGDNVTIEPFSPLFL